MLKIILKELKTFYSKFPYIVISIGISFAIGIFILVLSAILYFITHNIFIPFSVFAFCKGCGIAFISILTLALAVLPIVKKKVEDEKKESVQFIFRLLLCIIIICIIPFTESYGFHHAMEPWVSKVSKEDITPEPSDPTYTNSPEPELTFEISFEDILFADYSAEDLEEHKEELKSCISKKIFSDIVNSNEENTKEYVTKVEQAGDYEDVYFLIVENDLFKNHHLDFRYLILQHSIDLRIEANIYCVKFANQRLIVLRYIDLKDEYIRNKNTNELTSIYSEAIKWSLISSQTAYVEGENIYEMLNKASNLYAEFAKHLDPESESYQKAIILSDIYEDIKNDIN